MIFRILLEELYDEFAFKHQLYYHSLNVMLGGGIISLWQGLYFDSGRHLESSCRDVQSFSSLACRLVLSFIRCMYIEMESIVGKI